MTDLQPGAMLAHGKVWTSRNGMNVIFPAANNCEGNNHFGKPRGPIKEAIRKRVTELIEHTEPGWLVRYPNYAISVREEMRRSEYTYAVYVAEPGAIETIEDGCIILESGEVIEIPNTDTPA